MSRIKGKYVATVIINWDNERTENMLPIEEIRENANFLGTSIAETLMDAVYGDPKVEVDTQLIDFYEVEDDG